MNMIVRFIAICCICFSYLTYAQANDLATCVANPQMVADPAGWADIISHRPSTEVQRSVARQFPATPSSFHRIEQGRGPLNLDLYRVKIDRMPQLDGREMSRGEFFDFIRKNFSLWLDPSIASFSALNDTNGAVWNSLDPVGSILRFRMMMPLLPNFLYEGGSVVTTDFANESWIFSTLFNAFDLEHPVSGSRQFGFQQAGGSSYFFIRAADRATSLKYSVLDESVTFARAHQLWCGFMFRLRDWVNDSGGSANVADYQSQRVSWPDVLGNANLFHPSIGWAGELYPLNLAIPPGFKLEGVPYVSPVRSMQQQNGRISLSVHVAARIASNISNEFRIAIWRVSIDSSGYRVIGPGLTGSTDVDTSIHALSSYSIMVGSTTGRPFVFSIPDNLSASLVWSPTFPFGQTGGEIAGGSTNSTFFGYLMENQAAVAFRWHDQNGDLIGGTQEVERLRAPGNDWSYAYGGRADVTGGECHVGSPARPRPCIWRGGSPEFLSAPDGPRGTVYSIGPSDIVAGTLFRQGLGFRAVIWRNGQVTAESEGSGRFHAFLSVNSNGRAVGRRQHNDRDIAITWPGESGGIIDIETAVTPHIPILLNYASSINDFGMVAASGHLTLDASSETVFLILPGY